MGAVINVGERFEGVVVRFINEDGKFEEHAIDVVEAHDRNAQGLLQLLTTCLASLGIPLDGIVLQYYDGASVMSGHRGGLQTLLSVKCGRSCFVRSLFLPQITSSNHRYNHRYSRDWRPLLFSKMSL